MNGQPADVLSTTFLPFVKPLKNVTVRRTTIIVSLKLKDALDSLDRTDLFSALHSKDMLQKFINLRDLY